MTLALTTGPGRGVDTTVSASRDLTGYTVAVEYATSSDFKTVTITKTPVASGRSVPISLSSSEVDTLKDSYFRVRATKGTSAVTVFDGSIDYVPVANNGQLTIDKIVAAPELKAALVPGSVYANDRTTVVTTKRLHVVLTADGTDIDDLIIETVA